MGMYDRYGAGVNTQAMPSYVGYGGHGVTDVGRERVNAPMTVPGIYVQPTAAELAAKQRQEDRQLMFGGGANGGSQSRNDNQDAPDSSGFGGFDLNKALQTLLGTSGDVNTSVGDMSQQKEGLAKYISQLMSALGVSQNSLTGSLAQTGMSGKLGLTNADIDAQKATQAGRLTASQANQARDTYAGKQALFQGLIGSNVGIPKSSDVASMDIERPSTDVDLQAFVNPQRPKENSGELTRRMMSSGGVKRFDPFAAQAQV